MNLKTEQWESDPDKSDPEGDDLRFTLGCVREGLNVLCIGINPSTASICDESNGLKTDPTMNRVIKWVERVECDDNGTPYVDLMMVNPFPLRASTIEGLKQCLDKRQEVLDELLERNRRKTQEILRRKDHRFDIWLAWGDLIDELESAHRQQAIEFLKSIANAEPESRWFHVGSVTAKKNPRHPRLLKESERHYFDINAYIALLEGKLPG